MIVALVAQFFVIPLLKNKIDKEFELQRSPQAIELKNVENEEKPSDSSTGKTSPSMSGCKLLVVFQCIYCCALTQSNLLAAELSLGD